MTKWINSHSRQLPVRDRSKDEPGLIHLDRNEASFGPAPGVVDAIRQAAPTANRYPDSGAHALAAATAQYAGCKEENLVFGNGSDEVIELLSRTLLSNGDEIIVPHPTFFYYSNAARAVGGAVIGVRRNEDFTIDIESILNAVTDRTKIIYIANPNNPTGTLQDRHAIELLLKRRIPALLVVDECYFEFSGVTVSGWVPQHENLFVMRSFSKGFGLAGLRVGYGIGSPELCTLLYRSAQSYSVNRLAQAAACAALQDLEYARRQIAAVCLERERLDARLRACGVLTYPSVANFVLANLSSHSIRSNVIASCLREKGIAVADFGKAEGLNEFSIRITVGAPEENDRLLEALGEILARHRKISM